jgi:hypothetical protein
MNHKVTRHRTGNCTNANLKKLTCVPMPNKKHKKQKNKKSGGLSHPIALGGCSATLIGPIYQKKKKKEEEKNKTKFAFGFGP